MTSPHDSNGHAHRDPPPSHGAVVRKRAAPRVGWVWLAAIVAAGTAIGLGVRARAVRLELDATRELASAAIQRAERLRAELLELRRDQSVLSRVRDVVETGDARLVEMRGEAAAGGSGTALWSPTRGLVFIGLGLPALDAAHVYQLWVVPPSGAPVTAGLLTVTADGRTTHITPLAGVTAARLTVTVEPAGGSPAPTTPIVMSGPVR